MSFGSILTPWADLSTLRSQSDDRQLPLLRQLIRDYPDYTAGAIHAAILLRRMGTFEAPIVRHEPANPQADRPVLG